MKVKIKKLPKVNKEDLDAVIPKYAKEGDAGMDLTAVRKEEIGGNLVYYTGLAVEIPAGYVGLLFPRSSVAGKAVALTNAVGVIDSGYRGEIMMKFKPTIFFGKPEEIWAKQAESEYQVGERIGQLLILPYPQIEFVEGNLAESERGEGGFGSTNS